MDSDFRSFLPFCHQAGGPIVNATMQKPSMLFDLLLMNKCLSMFKAILTSLAKRWRLKCGCCLVKLGGFVKRDGHFNSKFGL